MANQDRLYQEYLRVMKEPDSPHKRRVMRRIEKALRNPTAPYDSKYVINMDTPGLTKYGDITATVGDLNDAHNLALSKFRGMIDAKAERTKRDNWLMTYGHRYDVCPGFQGFEGKRSPDEPARLGLPMMGMKYRSFGDRDPYSGAWTSPVAILDVETGSGQRPISIGAIKGYINKNTGEFFYTQGFERYYIPQNPSEKVYNMALETHKITQERARAYRQAQGATYPEVYGPGEREQLLSFLKGTVVGGHNILNFDFRSLGITNEMQNFRVIDTFLAAENLEVPKGHRGLEPMYKAFTGLSMKQAGLGHHQSFMDVMAEMDLLAAMFTMNNREGRDIRYILTHPNVSHAPFEWIHNSSVVRGGYRGAMEVANYMEGQTIDEQIGAWTDFNGVVHAPSGFSTSDPVGQMKDQDFNQTTFASSVATFSSTMINLTTALQKVKETMSQYVQAGYTPLEQFLSNRSPAAAKEYLEKKNIAASVQEGILERAGVLRSDKYNERYEALDGYVRDLMYTGKLSDERGDWYLEMLNTDPTRTPSEIRHMIQSDVRRESYDKKQAAAEEKARKAEEDQVWWDIKNEYDINKYAEKLSNGWREESYKKHDYIEKARRKGLISESDATGLRNSNANLIGSYEDLVDATDEVIDRNKQLLSIYQKFAEIKPYDVNQYMAAARTQWGGTMKAAQGVIPQFLLNPIGRLGEASFNYQEGKLAPWNAFNRTWNATIGQVGNAALGMGLSSGNPWAIGIGAVTGSVGAISQIYGNYKQQQMETRMLGIQNTLNTLGLITSWITTPFRLLQKAAKLLTGSFTGLTLSINKFMQNGIGLMSQMGNPLTELTGVNYAAYEGTTMMDVASLFNRGSMNSVYEDFAKQQKAFYTTGQVNQNRLIASSLLGVYSDVYNPSTDIEGTYNAMVNKLLANMKYQSPEQQARTMYLASQIDNNLPGLLRTANMLGVTDVNELTDPSRRGMYWRPLSDAQERGYRWTQYEYGAAQQQWGRSRMKLANIVWTAVGKDFYNGLNGFVDRLSANDWKGALDEVSGWWTRFKEKFTKAWEGIKNSFKEDGEEGSSIGGWSHGFKLLGLQIVKIALDVSETILNIWNSIMIQLADKAEGLVAYLSTLSLTPHYEDGKFWFEMNHIGTATPGDPNRKVYDTAVSPSGMPGKQTIVEDMGSFGAIADLVWSDKDKWFKQTATEKQLKADTLNYLLATGRDIETGTGLVLKGGKGYWQWGDAAKEEYLRNFEKVWNTLDIQGQGGPGWWDVAAWMMNDADARWKVEGFDDQVGLASGLSSLIASGNDPVSTSLSIIRDAVDDKIQIELKFMDEQGHTKASMLIDKFQNGVAKAVTKLQDLVPNLQQGYKLEAVKTGAGN